jgi:transcriptional regulator with XRE-family HTH domain
MYPWHRIRPARELLGLTQTGLAHHAGVSLPTIQNLEAGRANPTQATLAAVLGALGMELRLVSRPADWDALVRCGAPLLIAGLHGSPEDGAEVRETSFRPTPELLLAHLRDACLELTDEAEDDGQERRRDAVRALLVALRGHFPSFFREHLSGVPLYEGYLSAPVDGRTIRLAREAVAVLAEYL